MSCIQIKRALISVFDKKDVVELGKFLHENKTEIISTSKTAKMIKEAGVPVTNIEEVTDFPEIMSGRVKTLHPSIFAGILARRDNKDDLDALKKLNIKTIDLVVVNLYPFEETVSKPQATLFDAIENIDIGGPSMLRAAAKNHHHVVVITDPKDYQLVMDEMRANNGCVSLKTRSMLAQKVFKLTSTYDNHIEGYLDGYHSEKDDSLVDIPSHLEISLDKLKELRYGENPHQKANLYSSSIDPLSDSLASCEPLQGKEMSYNNFIDSQAAISITRDIQGENVVSIIKHNNPCGVGRSKKSLIEAYRYALECDPLSAFGGIVCMNKELDEELALEMKQVFTEVIIAPSYSKKALEIFSKKKNLRLLQLSLKEPHLKFDLKLIDGGALIQETDLRNDETSDARVVTKRAPDSGEMEKLKFAMSICKNVKSNAIVLANEKQSVGIGAGQTSRVDSVNIAINHSRIPLEGSVLASDAFFPFRDSIDLIAKRGIKAVIQPGGSVKDEEVIEACNEHNIAMLFTGIRHFKH